MRAVARRPRTTAGITAAGLGVITVVAVLLLTGCRAAGEDGSPGTGSPGTSGTDVVQGSDGQDGGDGVDGSGADGADGTDGFSTGSGPVLGSGQLTSQNITFSGVNTLVVGAHFEVRVTVGEPEQATIRMDDNLTELVDATVSGDQLRLGLTPGASVRNATLLAEVTVAELHRLTASGASQVTVDSVAGGRTLLLEGAGTSRITAAVDVEQLTVSSSGASVTTLSGRAGQLDLNGSGTAGLRLAELTVRELDAELSGTSCAAVAVSDTLAARTSGAATLRYSGNPDVTRRQSSGVSSIASDSSLSDRCGG